jgi:hypothetical protein
MEASKYFLYHVLLSSQEMESLISFLPPFNIYNVSGVTQDKKTSKEAFLIAYGQYIEEAARGEFPSFSAAWSLDEKAIECKEVRPGMFFQKAIRPVIHLRAHYYSISEKEVKPMSFGKKSIPWGLQFGFPLLYRDPETKEVIEPLKRGGGNLPLFQGLKGWMRANTRPVKMFIEGEEVMTTLRKGVGCEI